MFLPPCLYKILGKTFPIQIGKEKLINFASLSFCEYFFIYFVIDMFGHVLKVLAQK